MNSRKYPVNNYVPYNPDKELNGGKHGHDLDYTLKKHVYEKIISDPSYHFENSYVTNFDIINSQCRGDKMSQDKKNYETISNEKVNEEFNANYVKNDFISSAINSERKDVFLKKDLVKVHFTRINLEKKLEEKDVFLSSMKKRAFKKKSILMTVSLYFLKKIKFCYFLDIVKQNTAVENNVQMTVLYY